MLSYETFGNPNHSALFFLHGFLGCKEDWENVVSHLEDEFYCVCIDLPGHGSSFREESFEEDFAMLQQSLSLPKVALVGYSMGGRLALLLKEKYPENYSAIVLLSSYIGLLAESEKEKRREFETTWENTLSQDPFPNFLDKWYSQPLFSSLKENIEIYPPMLERRKKQDPEALLPMFQKMHLTRQSKNFSLEECYLLYGEKDEKYKKLYSSFSTKAVVEGIEGSGHCLHLESPKICAEKIKKFLKINHLSQKLQDQTMHNFPWKEYGPYTDIKYHKAEGIAKITINRPQVRNAFRPLTVDEMSHALQEARNDPSIGVIILTGEGKEAFCSGGDQKIRGEAGYKDHDGTHRLNVLDLQREIRSCPKPVIAMVAGYAIGGGHVLHVVCDLTIAADNAIFGQTGPKVGSFDGGFGSSYLARIVGQKKAREIWYLCKKYNAEEALQMGLVNIVVPYEKLEETTVTWCKQILEHSPIAIRCLKSAFNADCDGQAGIQELAGNATMLYYMTEEGQEGKNAFLEKRKPDFSQFPRRP